MNIFVAKLDYSIDGSFLQDLFEEYGEEGRAIVVKVANPRQDNNRGGGGGGYNRGRY
jgi:hypothetical protein